MSARSGRLVRVVVLACLLSAAAAGTATLRPFQEPAANPVVVYFEDGPWVAPPLLRDAVAYVPLTEMLRRLALPYTDATASGTLSIRGPRQTLVLERETGRITLDGEALDPETPFLHEDGRWLVPVSFLPDVLGPVAGVPFTRSGPRLVAGNVPTTPLVMTASAADGVTRLTLRLGRSSNVRVQRPEQNRVILNIDLAPLIPEREVLDYRNDSVRSIAFDDRDGRSRVVVETTPEVASVRLIPAEENRLFFLDLVGEASPATPVTTAPPPAAPSAIPDLVGPALPANAIRVIVIDPGHGGLDAGTSAHGILEKDLTLVLARRLAATLEERLTAAVLLTRQQDRSIGLEERAGSANQNRADLLISLHVGYSEDPTESGGTVFLMREPAASGTRATGPAGLFRPWYEAWRPASDPSRAFALLVGDRLGSRLPEWPFRIREAPLGLLASVTMPAAILELGNANNPEDMTRLGTPAFQNRIIDAIVDAVQSLGTPERGNAP